MKSITQALKFPVICSLCNQYHRHSHAVCEACYSLFTRIDAQSTSTQPFLDRIITTYRFEEPLRSLIHEFKYKQGFYLTSLLVQLMLDALPCEGYSTQCLIPIPTHNKRLRQRGFNQSAELTKRLGKCLNIPVQLFHCKKIKNTPPQAQLNAQQRIKNTQNSFSAKPLPSQHVTLVDDLFTTGSTANEVARILKQKGVVRIDLWCCAKA